MLREPTLKQKVAYGVQGTERTSGTALAGDWPPILEMRNFIRCSVSWPAGGELIRLVDARSCPRENHIIVLRRALAAYVCLRPEPQQSSVLVGQAHLSVKSQEYFIPQLTYELISFPLLSSPSVTSCFESHFSVFALGVRTT